MKKHFFAAIAIAACIATHAQIGVGTNDPKATLDVNAMFKTGSQTSVDGILIPRVDRERASHMTEVVESTLIYIDNITTGQQVGQTQKVDAIGFYYYKNDLSGNNGIWIKLGSEYAKPEFFYMPSVLLPTLATDELLTSNSTEYQILNGEYKVDLFQLFRKQFTQPITSSPEKIDLN